MYSGTRLKQISGEVQHFHNLIEIVLSVELLKETKFEVDPCFFRRKVLNIENHFALVQIRAVSMLKSSKSIQKYRSSWTQIFFLRFHYAYITCITEIDGIRWFIFLDKYLCSAKINYNKTNYYNCRIYFKWNARATVKKK